MTPKKDEYMRGYGDAFKEAVRMHRSELQELAATCHREKWQFSETDPSAFGVLHRIGDLCRARRPSPSIETRQRPVNSAA